MSSVLRSVGIDVGTTTTQLILSQITVENRASGFAVPEMEITRRQILYRSPVQFTPLLSGELVDGEKLRQMVTQQYADAGIDRASVDTGAIIITGETSRKENAAAVLSALSEFAGDFVVATAGPDLESVLSAKGAGAVERSARTGERVLHMDIGGGTSNLSYIENGTVTATGCLNVGGRLLRFDPQGTVTYVSPVLRDLISYQEGDTLTRAQAMEVARLLAGVLEMAAGLREQQPIFHKLTTNGTQPLARISGAVISFSGGVADCIEADRHWLAYGDLGVLLGRAIKESALCAGNYVLGEETIRATVIGAGCHSAQLSGSTVYLQNASLPLKNLPVAHITRQEQSLPTAQLGALIQKRLEALESWGVLSLPGEHAPDYGRVKALADAIAPAMAGRNCYIALQADMAKALGHALALRLDKNTSCVCIDRVALPEQSYLDIGLPVGPAVPIVIKTLILSS